MLGLDANNLAVADYEIIARIERIIASFNGNVIPVQFQPVVRIPSPPAKCQDNYSSTSSSTSPTRRHYHTHSHSHSSLQQREASPSPHHHSASSANVSHQHHYHESSSSSTTRARSKSPRKVTIDPNSY